MGIVKSCLFFIAFPSGYRLRFRVLTEGFDALKRRMRVFKNFDERSEKEQKELIELFFPEVSVSSRESAPLGTNRFYCLVGMADSFVPGLVGVNDVENGKLIHKTGQFEYFTPTQYCDSFQQIAFYGFDSSFYQTTSPIYYFHGQYDPNIPISYAYYHYAHQGQAKSKEFVEVDLMGHLPLVSELSECSAKIWEKVLAQESVYDVLDESHLCLDSWEPPFPL